MPLGIFRGLGRVSFFGPSSTNLRLLVPVVPSLLATGMPSSNYRARSRVASGGSYDCTTSRTPGSISVSLSISGTLAVRLLLILGLLLGLRLLLVLRGLRLCLR